MKIAVLSENTPFSKAFDCEHGLSIYIETKNNKILFDTGKSDIFYSNAIKLGIDLSKVDIAVLSHGHYDHGGGIKKFFEVNNSCPLYLNKNAFGDHRNALDKYIGLDKTLAKHNRFIFTDDELKINNELSLCTCNKLERKQKTDSAGLTINCDNVSKPDVFLHEQYLLINEENKRIVISGCSHKGILNITDWLKPDVLIGGFHFMKQNLPENSSKIDNAIENLVKSNTIYYTCHCTGVEQYRYMKNKMGNQLNYLASGQVITI